MRKVVLIMNTDKSLAIACGCEIIAWLTKRSIRPMLYADTAEIIGLPQYAAPVSDWSEAELMIVLGGDGTLIRAAQTAAKLSLPILGINTGHLGFLTEIENAEALDHLDQILSGHYVVEERLMLEARVERDGKEVLVVTALNDAVVSKGPRARLVHLDVAVGSRSVARYRADGVIISTPTGSTAYSLSAGGPIVQPTVDVLLVTPICPHTMSSRAMVVSGHEQVAVTVVETPGEVGLSSDGSDPFPLHKGDVVHLSRAPYSAKLVRRHSYRFFDVLREKISDNDR